MVPGVDYVRVTYPRYALSKKHILIAGGAALALILVVVALWKAARSSPLYPVTVNGKYGYINKSAQLKIQPQFDRAEQFAEGYAPVQIGNNWGYIDRTGRLTIPPQFHMADPFSDGLALVGLGRASRVHRQVGQMGDQSSIRWRRPVRFRPRARAGERPLGLYRQERQSDYQSAIR